MAFRTAKAKRLYLERCCGRQSWLGRPDALEPGVLTDCDLVWWGDPYLKETKSSIRRLFHFFNWLKARMFFNPNYWEEKKSFYEASLRRI